MSVTKQLVEGMIANWLKESYAVTHKGQPFAYFDTEAEAKKHLEKYAKKGDASSYKVVKEGLEESFSDAQIKALKSEYEKIGKINPDSPSYKKLTSMLDSMSDDMLKKLARADVKFVSALAKNRVIKRGLKESDLNESDYKVMHKSFTDAVNTAKEKAEKAGYSIDDDEWFRKVSSGPKKPGTDQTNRYTVELISKKGGAAKKALHFQVYNTGGAYELNAYIN